MNGDWIVWQIHVDHVILPDLGAVTQQRRRVLHDAADVKAGQRETLGARVSQERLDGRIQPLRFAEHDIHQLFLLGGERQFLPEDLNRAGHRRERIPDFVRDTGRHLADRGQPLPHARVVFELLDVG